MKKNKEKKKDVKKEIPGEIKLAFGKFYTYSVGIILLLLLVIILAKKLSSWFLITFMILTLVFYGYILFNLLKQKKKFMSSFMVIDILVFVLVYSLLLLKIIGISWKNLSFLYNTCYNLFVVNEEVHYENY